MEVHFSTWNRQNGFHVWDFLKETATGELTGGVTGAAICRWAGGLGSLLKAFERRVNMPNSGYCSLITSGDNLDLRRKRVIE